MSRKFKTKCQYFIRYRSEMTPGTNFAFNLRTSTSKTPNLCARVFILLNFTMRHFLSYTLYFLACCSFSVEYNYNTVMNIDNRPKPPSQQKLAEKLIILNERAQGLLTRLHYSKQVNVMNNYFIFLFI